MLFYKILASTIHGKQKKVIKNSKFKISATTWNGNFELVDESYSVLDIQNYFEYIIKKREKVNDNQSTRRYILKVENRVTFKIKAGHYLQLLMLETKLPRSTISKGNEDGNSENCLV